MKNKKRLDPRIYTSDGMRKEYDFSKGVRGKHAAKYAAGTNVVLLDPDVARAFPTPEAVNDTLRKVLQLTQTLNGRRKKRGA